jgi:hypothetical protein
MTRIDSVFRCRAVCIPPPSLVDGRARCKQWHRSRSADDRTIWGYDADTSELAYYSNPKSGAELSKTFEIEVEMLKHRRAVKVAADLVDVRIYVCTPQVSPGRH